MNNVEFIEEKKERFLEVLDKLGKIYDNKHEVLLCSDFMNGDEYKEIFESIKQKAEPYQKLIEKTVPKNKNKDYPIHEFACVEYMSKKGYKQKIGPSAEIKYDHVMNMIGIKMKYSYILDAYAFGTKNVDKVVHYVPNSKGPNNGQRIYFQDPINKINQKIMQGNDHALRYLCKVASVSGYLLGNEYLSSKEIDSMFGKKLKKKTKQLFLDNIINPYRCLK